MEAYKNWKQNFDEYEKFLEENPKVYYLSKGKNGQGNLAVWEQRQRRKARNKEHSDEQKQLLQKIGYPEYNKKKSVTQDA